VSSVGAVKPAAPTFPNQTCRLVASACSCIVCVVASVVVAVCVHQALLKKGYAVHGVRWSESGCCTLATSPFLAASRNMRLVLGGVCVDVSAPGVVAWLAVQESVRRKCAFTMLVQHVQCCNAFLPQGAVFVLLQGAAF
jgi:hypothetical protein